MYKYKMHERIFYTFYSIHNLYIIWNNGPDAFDWFFCSLSSAVRESWTLYQTYILQTTESLTEDEFSTAYLQGRAIKTSASKRFSILLDCFFIFFPFRSSQLFSCRGEDVDLDKIDTDTRGRTRLLRREKAPAVCQFQFYFMFWQAISCITHYNDKAWGINRTRLIGIVKI